MNQELDQEIFAVAERLAKAHVTTLAQLDDLLQQAAANRFPLPDLALLTFLGKGAEIVGAKDREAIAADWDPRTAKAKSALLEEEEGVTGALTRERLENEKLQIFGGRAFQHFLTHQEDIPEKWQGLIVFFDATPVRHPNGKTGSLCLIYNYDRWEGFFFASAYVRNERCVSAYA